MKISFLSLLLLLSIGVQGQVLTIPDANFKNALLHTNCVDTNNDGFGEFDADTNNDGEIDTNEALAVTGLILFNQNITSLEGIEHFTNLEILLCNTNNLNSLNLGQNTSLIHLNCGGNNLTNLDISANSLLTTLKCFGNNLTTLNTSNNPNLTYLNCSSNQLNNIEISQNSNLDWLICSSNPLTNIDVSQNTYLTNIYCRDTQIGSIDVSQNSLLTGIWCSDNPNLTSLNLANGNNANLNRMFAQNNPNLSCIQVDDLSVIRNYCNYDNEDFNGWCKDSSTSYSTSCANSISNESSNNIIIFPSPAHTTLQIKYDNSIQKIQIYNTQGILIFHGIYQNNIDVSKLASGIYFIKIKTKSGVITKKIVKS